MKRRRRVATSPWASKAGISRALFHGSGDEREIFRSKGSIRDATED